MAKKLTKEEELKRKKAINAQIMRDFGMEVPEEEEEPKNEEKPQEEK